MFGVTAQTTEMFCEIHREPDNEKTVYSAKDHV